MSYSRRHMCTKDAAAISFDFTRRANLRDFPELMDQPAPFEELRECLRGIAGVNALVRAYHPTFHWLGHVYSRLPRQTQPLHIVDVGCGYGDLLRRIHRWAKDRNLPVTLTGIDLNADAVRAAREVTIPGTVTYLAGNAYDFAPKGGIDLVVSSLTAHHMEDRELVEFVAWMERTTRIGWFINDLERQPLPYHLFKMLAFVMPWHRFVKHDGPVSILRSFRMEDWRRLCAAAGLARTDYVLRRYRPARLCVARLRPPPAALTTRANTRPALNLMTTARLDPQAASWKKPVLGDTGATPQPRRSTAYTIRPKR